MTSKVCYKKWMFENGDHLTGSYDLLPPISVLAAQSPLNDSGPSDEDAAEPEKTNQEEDDPRSSTLCNNPSFFYRQNRPSIMAPISHLIAPSRQLQTFSGVHDDVYVPPRRADQTVILYDDLFMKHKTAQSLECPARVEVLCGAQGVLRQNKLDFRAERLRFKQVEREASLADVLRVHEWEYVHDLMRKCEIAKRSPRGRHYIDPPGHPRDTMVSGDSYRVAVLAAGAACAGVDAVLSGEAQNAFVPLRPPGHHAGPSGLVYSDDGCPAESQGFCLLNNAMIAAAYAKYAWRNTIRKVAIVDFDVHAGNGSCAIVRNLRPHTHTRRIAPQTSVTVPSYKPWLDQDDSENVFFASIHLQHDEFYPRQASTRYDPSSEPEFVGDASGTLADPNFPWIVNVPMQATSSHSECSPLYRRLVSEEILPKLRAFGPDLLIISAGFDGHHEDIDGNRGMFHLEEDDFEWITEELIQVAKTHAKGRIVSVLEGGYHVPKPTRKRKVADAFECSSALATSCVVHVRALMNA